MKREALRHDQRGFAAMVIAIVLVLVISLLTVGFAELMRKETRNALDRHLSDQAYYAAESGVNDASEAIDQGYVATKQTCAPLASGDAAAGSGPLQKPAGQVDNVKYVGNQSDNVSVTCLLIDPAPSTLEYGCTDETPSRVLELSGVQFNDPSQPATIDRLVISWEDCQRRTNFATTSSQTFPPVNSWTSNTGIVRVSLTPLLPGAISRDAFRADTYQAFLYPNSASPNANITNSNYTDSLGDQAGQIFDGNCNTSPRGPRYCSVNINLNGPLTHAQINYLLALRWIYSSSHITITAYDHGNNQLKLKNAQVLVDSTGKAQDILRRVQVRIPVHDNFDHTDYGLEVTNGICKQLQVIPNQNPTRGACTP